MKKILLLSLFLMMVTFMLASKAQASTFAVHLYYDSASKVIRFDNTASKNVSLNDAEFVSVFDFSNTDNPGGYVASLYDETGALLISGIFAFSPGAFTLDVPYVSIASGLKIFSKASNKELLSADLAQFVTCNRNSICEFEKGENVKTCIVDCANSKVTFSPATLEKLNENGGKITDPQTGAVLLQDPAFIPAAPASQSTPAPQPAQKSSVWTYVLLILAMIIVIAAGFIIYKKFKNQDQ